MSSRPEIEESSLSKSLARIDRYLARLQQLPPASEFTVAVEQDMWETGGSTLWGFRLADV